jgi:hypothetical protein
VDPPFVAGAGENGYDESACHNQRPPLVRPAKGAILRNLFGGELLRQQLSEHKRQNPAVPKIIDLDRRIDPQLHRD